MPTPIPFERFRAGRLQVTVLDVAQGDATLVRWPDGRAWLIDAGGTIGRFDIGTRIVSPALWALSVRRLSTLVLTHGDRDHVGGAAAVLRDFAPTEIWEGIPVEGHVDMARLRDDAGRRHLRWRTARLDDRAAIGGATVRVWHPAAAEWTRRRVRNEDSIVLEVALGDVSLILPGDIGVETERILTGHWSASRAKTARPAGMATTPESARTAETARTAIAATIRVLKVPHHGSRTSSTPLFLDTLAPQVALVSAGRGNRFGHPAPAVLARYDARGAALFRTDRDGAIQLDTDGRTLVVRTCSGRRLDVRAGGLSRSFEGA